MNKSELTDTIAEEADISKASAARALDAALDAIATSLRNGEPVALVGFGTFSVRERGREPVATRAPARRSRSPRPSCPRSSRVGR